MPKKDQDGFFYIVGRKDRHVKLYGERINLEDIENEIKKYGYENVCTNKNEKLVIYIKLEKFKSNNKIEEFLISKVSQFLKINSNIIKIKNIRKIPRNSQGKIIYKDLEVS